MPNSILEHADVLWKLVVALTLSLLAAWGFIASLYKSRVTALEEIQKKIVKMIPAEALEKRIMLVTESDCDTAREKCPNVLLGKELTEGLKVIRKAILVLILYSENVPQEERDRIVKGLVD